MSLEFGKLDFAVSFNRLTAFPLDAKSYFESYAAAEAAAKTARAAGSTETTYYFGQTVTVVENNIADLYQIQPDGTLSPIGGDIAINSNVFTTDADGSLNLAGFADAVAGAQLVKGADGSLSWVKPDETTIEGLGTAVETLKTDVSDIREDITDISSSVSELENKVGDPANSELGTEATGLYAEIERLDKEKASMADVNAAVAAADHLKRKIVAEYEDIQTYIDENEDEDQYIFMVPNGLTDYDNKYKEYVVIAGVIEPVGTWEVNLSQYVTDDELTSILSAYLKAEDLDLSDYITNSALTEALADYVAKEDGKSLISDSLITKIQDLAEIKDVSADLTISDEGILGLSATTKTLIDSKVTAIEGFSLVSNALIEKLEKLNENGEANFIKSVDTATLNVDDKGHLTLVSIDAAKVSGLEEAIADAALIKTVSSDFTITEAKELTLNTLSTDKVEGLTDFITNTNKILIGDESTTGLVTKVSSLEDAMNNLSDNYVTLVKYNAEVGDLTQLVRLVGDESTIVDEINYINERLKWEELK